MDFLLDCDEAIQWEVAFSVANLLNLEVDVRLFDTTSTHFETDDDDDFRRCGHSKDHRPDRPQVMIGMAVTKQGIPVRCWPFPGNESAQLIIREVQQTCGSDRSRGGPGLATRVSICALAPTPSAPLSVHRRQGRLPAGYVSMRPLAPCPLRLMGIGALTID